VLMGENTFPAARVVEPMGLRRPYEARYKAMRRKELVSVVVPVTILLVLLVGLALGGGGYATGALAVAGGVALGIGLGRIVDSSEKLGSRAKAVFVLSCSVLFLCVPLLAIAWSGGPPAATAYGIGGLALWVGLGTAAAWVGGLSMVRGGRG
jgi:hypothetical protein